MRAATLLPSLGLLLASCTSGEPPREDAGAAPAEAVAPSDASVTAPVELLPALEGAEWVVEELEGAPPPEGILATLTLDREARQVSGSGGCNRYAGAYELAGGRLRFGTMGGTRRACAADVMAFEDAFMVALRRVGSYRLSGSALDLLGDAGAVVRLRAR